MLHTAPAVSSTAAGHSEVVCFAQEFEVRSLLPAALYVTAHCGCFLLHYSLTYVTLICWQNNGTKTKMNFWWALAHSASPFDRYTVSTDCFTVKNALWFSSWTPWMWISSSWKRWVCVSSNLLTWTHYSLKWCEDTAHHFVSLKIFLLWYLLPVDPLTASVLPIMRRLFLMNKPAAVRWFMRWF